MGCLDVPGGVALLQFADGDEVETFWNCPSKFIPKTVYNWYEIFKAYQRNRMCLPRLYQARYSRFCDTYESYLSFFQTKVMEDQARKQKMKGVRRANG